MKDKDLRKDLQHMGLLDSLERYNLLSDEIPKMKNVSSWYEYTYSREKKKLGLLEKKFNALLEHLKLEEVYVEPSDSTYKFRKIKARKS